MPKSTVEMVDCTPVWCRATALPGSGQVYRLVVERPERLSLKILMALLDLLNCTMDDLIEPVAVLTAARPRKAVGAEAGVGELRPKRARITPVDE